MNIKKEICQFCKQEYDLGYNGTVNGCDRCLGYTRDKNGHFWAKDEKVARYVDLSTGRHYVLTREEAFNGEENEQTRN